MGIGVVDAVPLVDGEANRVVGGVPEVVIVVVVVPLVVVGLVGRVVGGVLGPVVAVVVGSGAVVGEVGRFIGGFLVFAIASPSVVGALLSLVVGGEVDRVVDGSLEGVVVVVIVPLVAGGAVGRVIDELLGEFVVVGVGPQVTAGFPILVLRDVGGSAPEGASAVSYSPPTMPRMSAAIRSRWLRVAMRGLVIAGGGGLWFASSRLRAEARQNSVIRFGSVGVRVGNLGGPVSGLGWVTA